jgi:hypothetical protein
MEGNMYYVVLVAFSVMALLSLKHDRWMFAFIFIVLATWVYYTHETGVTFNDLKNDLSDAVDESAQERYESGIRNEGFEYNLNKVK